MKILINCKFAIISLIVALSPSIVSASDFIDTQKSRSPITLGIRFGITNSKQGMNFDEIYSNTRKCHTEWGTGFDLGAVVNLNIRNFFSLQPGFIFQNRSFDYTVISADYATGSLSDKFGHTRYYYFQLPVMMCFNFDLSHDFRWSLEAGPYFGFGLGGDNKIESISSTVSSTETGGTDKIEYINYKSDFFGDGDGRIVGIKKFDWGLKFGTGFTFRKHYYLGVHYSAGCKNVANDNDAFRKKPSAKNKQWSISVGYEF